MSSASGGRGGSGALMSVDAGDLQLVSTAERPPSPPPSSSSLSSSSNALVEKALRLLIPKRRISRSSSAVSLIASLFALVTPPVALPVPAQYRQMRRKEQDRLARIEVDYQKRKEIAKFNIRREERFKAAEERTAKKQVKRQKKKQRKKKKKIKVNAGGEEGKKYESSDDDADSENDEVDN